MQSSRANERLWATYIDQRDNGLLTIGSVFQLVSPCLIITDEIGGIPVLQSEKPAILMRYPLSLQKVPIDNNIQGDKCLAFTLTNTKLLIGCTSVVETTCCGNFCDRQHVDEIKISVRNKCGCYNMKHGRGGLAVKHFIQVTDVTNGEVQHITTYFLSKQFSTLYLDSPFPSSTLSKQGTKWI